jgi:uncharacterized protein YbbK (DUF523 family)
MSERIIMILVSGCLVGQKCSYNMVFEDIPRLKDMIESGEAIPICPAQLGGLPTPRPPSEIVGGDGLKVINGKAKVKNSEGKDVTEKFLKGASDVLVIAKDNNVTKAILRSRSPLCGCGLIYDGTFAGKTRSGDGVAAALLKKHGITVITEEEFSDKHVSVKDTSDKIKVNHK